MTLQTLKHACRREGIKRWPHRTLFGPSGSAEAASSSSQGCKPGRLAEEGSGSACSDSDEQMTGPEGKILAVILSVTVHSIVHY